MNEKELKETDSVEGTGILIEIGRCHGPNVRY
jgi:hypothetical protein